MIDVQPSANAVRYGTAKGEWFLNATIVLPSGEVIKTRQRSRKSSAGFDLTKLFIGAEGTLGIVTEGRETLWALFRIAARTHVTLCVVTIRLTPLLPTTVAMVHFPNVQKATEASIEALNIGAGIRTFTLPSPRSSSFTDQSSLSLLKQNASNSSIPSSCTAPTLSPRPPPPSTPSPNKTLCSSNSKVPPPPLSKRRPASLRPSQRSTGGRALCLRRTRRLRRSCGG